MGGADKRLSALQRRSVRCWRYEHGSKSSYYCVDQDQDARGRMTATLHTYDAITTIIHAYTDFLSLEFASSRLKMWMGMLVTKNKRLLRQHRLFARQLSHQDGPGGRSGLDDACFDNGIGSSGGMLEEIESLECVEDEEVCGYGCPRVTVMVEL